MTRAITEPADKPASSERQWTPPPDNPGQPSRLESLARAREAQQENGSPHTESTDTGTRPTEQRDDQPTTAQPESGGNELDTGERPSGLGTKEARDDSRSEGTGSWGGSERRRAEPTNVKPVRDARPPGESGEVKTDGPGAANGPGAEGGREPNAEPATVGGPRAKSIARAIERQKAEAEGANASGTDTPRPEAGKPRAGDDRTDTGQRDDGEPSEPEASEPVDAEAAHPALGDGLGRRASAEDPGATDGVEPSARDRGPGMAEAVEPQQRTDEPETDGPKAAEGDNPAVAEPPDAGAFAEPSEEAADQPTERTQDVANDGEGGGPELDSHTTERPPEAPEMEPGAADDAEQTDRGGSARLEGERDYVVDDPSSRGRTITDIDRIDGGVLWEEKSATNASDTQRWTGKHIDKKFASYLDARQYLVGYEQAPIGFRFTSSGVDPEFRNAVEYAVERLRNTHRDVRILLEWS